MSTSSSALLAGIGILASACAHGGMGKLYAPPEELSYPIDPACEVAYAGEKPPDPGEDVDCKEERRRGMTRRAQAGVYTDLGDADASVRLVLLGDAGVRDPDDDTRVGDGPRATHQAVVEVCGGTCDGVVFLGDNLYQHGVNDQTDSAFLEAFARLWSDVGPQFYVPGNHDWGTFPVIAPPQVERAQRQLGELRRLQAAGVDVRGDSHFWSTGVGGGRLVGLDTNYLVRACVLRGKGEETRVACAGDPGRKDEGRVRFATMVEGLTAPGMGPSVVVGHHPWVSRGEHGEAGDYWDFNLFGPQGLGRGDGEAFRFLLDTVVQPNAALYISGHDHNSQVARIDDGTLSVVVGAGGKVTGPGKKTGPGGERRLEGFEAEHFCSLGFALVEVRDRALRLELHTLPAPTATAYDREHYEECVEHWEAYRVQEDGTVEARTDGPTCTAWSWTQSSGTEGTWGAPEPCVAEASAE